MRSWLSGLAYSQKGTRTLELFSLKAMIIRYQSSGKKQMLSSESADSWLMIIDGADDHEVS